MWLLRISRTKSMPFISGMLTSDRTRVMSGVDFKQGQPFDSVAGFEYGVGLDTGLAEDALDDLAHRGGVVDEEDLLHEVLGDQVCGRSRSLRLADAPDA